MAEGALGRHGVSANELAVGRDQAAEVLGPGAVDGAVEQDPPDLPGPQLLRVGREPEKAVDLSLRQKPLGLGRWVLQPRDVPVGIEPDLADVADIGEPLGCQKLLGYVLGRHTDAGYLRQADPGRLRWRLGSPRP